MTFCEKVLAAQANGAKKKQMSNTSIIVTVFVIKELYNILVFALRISNTTKNTSTGGTHFEHCIEFFIDIFSCEGSEVPRNFHDFIFIQYMSVNRSSLHITPLSQMKPSYSCLNFGYEFMRGNFLSGVFETFFCHFIKLYNFVLTDFNSHKSEDPSKSRRFI